MFSVFVPIPKHICRLFFFAPHGGRRNVGSFGGFTALQALGLGKELVAYAADYAKDHLGAQKIQIGIVEENTVLKAWYQSQGFIHTGTKTFGHLPFTVGFMELKF